MRCYKHSEIEACGVCTSCGRAMCKSCEQIGDNDELVCSTTCCHKSARNSVLQSLQTENVRLTCESCTAIRIPLLLLGWLCVLIASGELIVAFVLSHFVRRFRYASPWKACGAAFVFCFAAATCIYGARALGRIVARYEKELDRLQPENDQSQEAQRT